MEGIGAAALAAPASMEIDERRQRDAPLRLARDELETHGAVAKERVPAPFEVRAMMRGQGRQIRGPREPAEADVRADAARIDGHGPAATGQLSRQGTGRGSDAVHLTEVERKPHPIERLDERGKSLALAAVAHDHVEVVRPHAPGAEELETVERDQP